MRQVVLWLAVSFPALGILGMAASMTDIFRRGGPVDHWQTLIAGVIAIGAALIGGAFVDRQIRETARLEREARARRFAAARAVLPLTLSEAGEYARRCTVALKRVREQRGGESIPDDIAVPDYPALPAGLISGLRDTIEHADSDVYVPVAELLGRLQVVSDRVQSLLARIPAPRSSVTVHEVEGYIVDCAEVHARASLMYDFARRKSEAIRTAPQLQDIKTSLHSLGFWDFENTRVYETAARQFPEA